MGREDPTDALLVCLIKRAGQWTEANQIYYGETNIHFKEIFNL